MKQTILIFKYLEKACYISDNALIRKESIFYFDFLYVFILLFFNITLYNVLLFNFIILLYYGYSKKYLQKYLIRFL